MSQVELVFFADGEVERYPLVPGSKEKNGCSSLAAARIAPTAAQLCALCLRSLKDSGPATADELAARLDRSILTIRPRVSELNKIGKIEQTGQRRKNSSGMSAAEWKIV